MASRFKTTPAKAGAQKLPKILVIVGPTASGKTGLGIRLAKKFRGEIVSADSRLIYKGMDIGTAKPTEKEMADIPHHLIDLVSPSRTLTAAEWKKKAVRTILDILKRGKLPIVVGGTGLYVRTLVDNLEIPEVAPQPELRAKLEAMPRAELFAWLHALDSDYAARIGPNPRYAIRALEVMRATGQSVTELQKEGKPLFDFLQIGLRPKTSELEVRISKRVHAMFKAGLVTEVRKLRKKYGEDAQAMTGIGYRELYPYIRGEITLEKAIEDIILHTRQYAKRQMTWFKRDKRIQWTTLPEKGLQLAKKFLNA